MKLTPGISFNIPEPAKRVADYVSMSEQAGFQGSAFLTDSQLIWRDVYVSFTLALQQSNHIRIGTGVTNPVTRDPTATAGAIATLDELAPGRVILGMGAGDSAVHTLHRPPANLDLLRKSVVMIRGLLRGDEVPHGGRMIRLPWSKRHVPIFIASTGPNSLRLAGEIGDGVIINVGAHPDLVKWGLSHVKEGAAKAGRNLDEIEIWVRVTCAPDEDKSKARALIKGAAATKANGLARYAKDASFRQLLSKELVGDLEELAQRYDYYEHEVREAKHALTLSDRILEDLVIAGPSSYCVSRIGRIMEETGLGKLSFATYGFPDIPGFIKKFMAEIAPQL